MPDTEQAAAPGRLWRLLREAFAILLWLFILAKLLVFDIDVFLIERFSPSFRFILNFKLFLIAAILATMLLLFRGPNFRNSVIYIILYPIIVIFWKLPKLLLRNWPLAITFAPAVYEVLRSFRFTFAIYSFAALSALFVFISNNSYVLIPSMAFLFFFLGTHLYDSARKAYRSSMFSGLAGLVRDFRIKLQSRSKGFDLWKKVEVNPAVKETRTTYEQQLSLFYYFNWGFEFVAEKLHEVARGRRIDLYLLLCWLWTFSLTALVYAFEYYSLQKLIPEAFSENALSFWAFLGFSFGKLLPSSVSTLSPIDSTAVLMCYSQLVC